MHVVHEVPGVVFGQGGPGVHGDGGGVDLGIASLEHEKDWVLFDLKIVNGRETVKSVYP